MTNWPRAAHVAAAVLLAVAAARCDSGGQATGPAESSPRQTREAGEIDSALKQAGAAASRDGVAAAILIDVSGSMDRAAGGGDRTKKIVVARRAALDLVDQFAKYAKDHPGEPVQLGIYEFSRRPGEPDCREVIAMGPPDRTTAAASVDRMNADGGTPIGNAMIAGKRALDATGLSRRHLLVITDGDNTDGFRPDEVAAGLLRVPDAERASLYFVAFDTDGRRFEPVKKSGGLVLEAVNAKALGETLDMLLSGKILIEK